MYARWVCRCRCRALDLGVCLAASVVLLVLLLLVCLFVQHGSWMAANVYSSPLVVMDAEEAGVHLDDFREAYSWLRSNTAPDAKILSWWDYGYQLAALANRTTFVDNNTWNNTHIAAVGRVLASSEQESARLMREMGADYLMVVFGGVVGFASDDLGKMLWPIRIASGVFPNAIRESDYLNLAGQFRVDGGAAQAVKDSLLLKCSYYDFEKLNDGYDLARMSNSPYAKTGGIALEEFEEAYTTSNWMVRLFRVKPLASGGNRMGYGGETAPQPQPQSQPQSKGRGRRRRRTQSHRPAEPAGYIWLASTGPRLFRRAPP